MMATPIKAAGSYVHTPIFVMRLSDEIWLFADKHEYAQTFAQKPGKKAYLAMMKPLNRLPSRRDPPLPRQTVSENASTPNLLFPPPFWNLKSVFSGWFFTLQAVLIRGCGRQCVAGDFDVDKCQKAKQVPHFTMHHSTVSQFHYHSITLNSGVSRG